ncbi:MAG: NAD(P)H-binding protein, partial [Alphaproteobacteria bacterium]|nr:NAD(P)H-binding protein [Alphaproteobacteria bacterium]
MIVIFGATGNIGSALVKELKAKGAAFRCAVRDPEAAHGKLGDGVELVQADLSDRASVDAAVAGADKVFLVCGHSPALSDLEGNAIEAAKAAGVKLFVKCSGSTAGITPDAESVVGRAHYAGEQALKASGMDYVILQPNLFFQTLLAQAPMIASDSKMALPLATDAPLSMIDTRDIGAVAAEILTGDGHAGQTYYLSGAASNLEAFAAELTKQLGRDIAVMTPPLEAAGK